MPIDQGTKSNNSKIFLAPVHILEGILIPQKMEKVPPFRSGTWWPI